MQEAIPGIRARRPLRRTERAVNAAIIAGRDGARADPRFAAAETLAREIAAAVDVAAADKQVYAVAQLGPRLLEVLRELRLTPAAAELDLDPVTEFLRELSEPEMGDPAAP